MSANLTPAGRIRCLRQDRGWSQEHLSEAAGLSLRTIQRVEKGTRFSDATARALAAAFDIPLDTLLLPNRQHQRAAGKPLFGLSNLHASLVCAGLRLTPGYFVLSNLLVFQFGLEWARPLLFGDIALATLAHPLFLLASLILAILIAATQLVSLETRRSGPRISLRALHVNLSPGPVIFFSLSSGILSILLGYAVMENLFHLLEDHLIS